MILVKYENTGVMFCHKIVVEKIHDECGIVIELYYDNDYSKQIEYQFGEKSDSSLLPIKKGVKIKYYTKKELEKCIEKFKSTILLRCFVEKNIDLDNLDGLLNIGL